MDENENDYEIKYKIILEIAEQLDIVDEEIIEEINNEGIELKEDIYIYIYIYKYMYKQLRLINLGEMEYIPLEDLEQTMRNSYAVK